MNGCAPAGCTLPTEQQPLRLAEWNRLFTDALVEVTRRRPTSLALTLSAAGGVEAEVRDLAGRESSCCSFFAFTITPSGPTVVVEVGVPASRVDALDWLESRIAPAVSRTGP
ncbi:hypothetical protein BBK14_27715 [Parafrankia soli]|uniref:Arsenate reductase n=1 Tax=Parafrankia soli TaxID=2599596 RepID=A0A1S1PC25_9ACTN|nr:hypothetical protein [Parafrankia soli]OHV20503.1 hypothetical protein BBK14_27715 [Parafrankia soli]